MITFYENKNLEVAAFQQAKENMAYCGDGHLVITEEDYAVCAVVDGLGSGKGAYESADVVIKEVERNHHLSPNDIVNACNKRLLGKRGAVITLMKIDFKHNVVYYSNYGNVSFVLYYPNGKIIQPIPKRGYLSGRQERIELERYPYEEGSTFIVYTDGVKKPPAKERLVGLNKVKEEANALFGGAIFEQDDVTLLIGKLH
ncbi:indirect negative regulator of sigma-B activity [Alkalihalobacillus alcalophilus ATCC 27647 = CGMCC 1.3604]|uniref:Indirect negative regulator of sigma-B activity n=1 Tax=Alkalihalobacillus alcalophilus ATCC 27647 = CGMCC 1.3604 TaxID=1218173 RepID=A0A094WJU9_ALKAL|nr:SpoIIE family protein phosphatase [Alkalihalobacillus alcalophilus]KGA96208.1 indirect negative regulator of sigma-B activity [Alkalihalobacillus alcalophilus ATCC 27647 = CGMCC 1.3604]MED1563012.1 SpoIIE family protein phosphatase [Alkalihalobacillus alcalophilus]